MAHDEDGCLISAADLLTHFEEEIRSDCRSIDIAVSSSFAGKELRKRGEEAGRIIIARLIAMNNEQLDDAGVRIRDGLVYLLGLIAAPIPARNRPGSGVIEVTRQAGLSV